MQTPRHSLSTTILITAAVFIVMMIVGNLFLLGLSLVAGTSINDLLSGSTDASHPAFKLGFGINHLLIITGTAIATAFFLKQGKTLKEYFSFQNTWDWSLLGKAIVCLVIAYPLGIMCSSLITSLPLPDWATQMDTDRMDNLMGLIKMTSITDLIINLLIIGVFAGLGEELLFRGVLQQEAERHLGRPLLAISIVALLFAIIHLEVAGLPIKFLLGFIFGVTYYVSRDIKYSILLHIVNNSVPVISIYIAGDYDTSTTEQPEVSTLQSIISLAICLPLFYLAVKQLLMHKKDQLETTNEWREV